MMVGICTAYGMFQDTITNRELCGKVGYVLCMVGGGVATNRYVSRLLQSFAGHECCSRLSETNTKWVRGPEMLL